MLHIIVSGFLAELAGEESVSQEVRVRDRNLYSPEWMFHMRSGSSSWNHTWCSSGVGGFWCHCKATSWFSCEQEIQEPGVPPVLRVACGQERPTQQLWEMRKTQAHSTVCPWTVMCSCQELSRWCIFASMHFGLHIYVFKSNRGECCGSVK